VERRYVAWYRRWSHLLSLSEESSLIMVLFLQGQLRQRLASNAT
jgi:hypothetical protein